MPIGLPAAIPVKASGLFDYRSDPSDIEVGVARLNLNVSVSEPLKPKRPPGWRRLFGESPYGFNNQDLHDQLIELQHYYPEYDYYGEAYCEYGYETRGGCREAILHLTEFSSDSGTRKLIAMTQKRWYELNERGGNWRLLADGLGSPNSNGGDLPGGFSLNYTNWINWDVTSGEMDLVGANYGGNQIYNFLPGNGLYVDDHGSGPAFYGELQSKTDFAFTPGNTYRLSIYIAGNQRESGNRSTRVRVGSIIDNTVVRSWMDNFTQEVWTFTVGAPTTGKIIINGLNTGGGVSFGNLFDRVQLENVTTGAIMLYDDFDNENITEDDCEPCSGPRWLSAQLLGYLVGVNGLNNVMAYKMGDAPDGCHLWSARPIPELLDLNIPKAGVVAQFKGFILIADIEQDGIRRPGRVMWSDFNEPLSWLPLPGTSLAGFADIGFSEKVLRMEPMGDYLMVYTDKAIHRGQLVLRQEASGIISEVFHFTQVYRGPHSLRYKFSLVNNGSEHLYAAVDGIYVIANPFASRPERVEWLHRADGIIYDGATRWSSELQSLPDEISDVLQFGPVNSEACDSFIGGYNALTKEIWWSWATDDNECANVSLRVSLQYQAASLVDHGFSAFTLFRSDTRPTFAQWLEDLQVCLASAWDHVKEGSMQGEEDAFAEPVPYIWNEEEDPDGVIEPDSLCAILGNTTLEDICSGCESAPIFIGASAVDFTLKEFADDFYAREHWNELSYQSLSYPTLIQSGAMNFASENEKAYSEIVVGYKALPQTEPSLLYAHAGYGPQAECPTWKDVGARELMCLTQRTLAQHQISRTKPSIDANYPFWWRGIYLYYRVYILGTGGAATFNRIAMRVRNAQNRI